jgi:hypothetical protein
LPVSTTQVVSGSVMGAGATRRFSAVRWGVARRIVWAWLFTIPASAVLAAVAALTIEAGPVTVTLAVLVLGGVLLSLLVRQRRRRQPSVDAVMGSMEGSAAAGEGVSPNSAAQKSDRDGGQRVAAGVAAAPDKSRRDGR